MPCALVKGLAFLWASAAPRVQVEGLKLRLRDKLTMARPPDPRETLSPCKVPSRIGPSDQLQDD